MIEREGSNISKRIKGIAQIIFCFAENKNAIYNPGTFNKYSKFINCISVFHFVKNNLCNLP